MSELYSLCDVNVLTEYGSLTFNIDAGNGIEDCLIFPVEKVHNIDLDYFILHGRGNMFRGIFTEKIKTINTPQLLMDVLTEINGAAFDDSFVYIMNNSTWEHICNNVIWSSGSPVYTIDNKLINSKKVIINEHMPDIKPFSTPILFGRPDMYKIVEKEDGARAGLLIDPYLFVGVEMAYRVKPEQP